MEVAPQLPLTAECRHYNRLSEVPGELQKYWHQRYSLFSYYDDDIRLTHDAWFGVSPEPVASQIAAQMAAAYAPSKTVLVDLFAGAGGNTIAFALTGRWARIVAVERDAATLACAQHNADVYGVAGCITWVLGDSLAYLRRLCEDPGAVPPELRVGAAEAVLFGSPPWGGVHYGKDDVFDLETMEPYGLGALQDVMAPYDHALYLPRTSDVRQIAALAEEGEKIEVVQYCLRGASKAMVAYIPAKA